MFIDNSPIRNKVAKNELKFTDFIVSSCIGSKSFSYLLSINGIILVARIPTRSQEKSTLIYKRVPIFDRIVSITHMKNGKIIACSQTKLFIICGYAVVKSFNTHSKICAFCPVKDGVICLLENNQLLYVDEYLAQFKFCMNLSYPNILESKCPNLIWVNKLNDGSTDDMLLSVFFSFSAQLLIYHVSFNDDSTFYHSDNSILPFSSIFLLNTPTPVHVLCQDDNYILIQNKSDCIISQEQTLSAQQYTSSNSISLVKIFVRKLKHAYPSFQKKLNPSLDGIEAITQYLNTISPHFQGDKLNSVANTSLKPHCQLITDDTNYNAYNHSLNNNNNLFKVSSKVLWTSVPSLSHISACFSFPHTLILSRFNSPLLYHPLSSTSPPNPDFFFNFASTEIPPLITVMKRNKNYFPFSLPSIEFKNNHNNRNDISFLELAPAPIFMINFPIRSSLDSHSDKNGNSVTCNLSTILNPASSLEFSLLPSTTKSPHMLLHVSYLLISQCLSSSSHLPEIWHDDKNLSNKLNTGDHNQLQFVDVERTQKGNKHVGVHSSFSLPSLSTAPSSSSRFSTSSTTTTTTTVINKNSTPLNEQFPPFFDANLPLSIGLEVNLQDSFCDMHPYTNSDHPNNPITAARLLLQPDSTSVNNYGNYMKKIASTTLRRKSSEPESKFSFSLNSNMKVNHDGMMMLSTFSGPTLAVPDEYLLSFFRTPNTMAELANLRHRIMFGNRISIKGIPDTTKTGHGSQLQSLSDTCSLLTISTYVFIPMFPLILAARPSSPLNEQPLLTINSDCNRNTNFINEKNLLFFSPVRAIRNSDIQVPLATASPPPQQSCELYGAQLFLKPRDGVFFSLEEFASRLAICFASLEPLGPFQGDFEAQRSRATANWLHDLSSLIEENENEKLLQASFNLSLKWKSDGEDSSTSRLLSPLHQKNGTSVQADSSLHTFKVEIKLLMPTETEMSEKTQISIGVEPVNNKNINQLVLDKDLFFKDNIINTDDLLSLQILCDCALIAGIIGHSVSAHYVNFKYEPILVWKDLLVNGKSMIDILSSSMSTSKPEMLHSVADKNEGYGSVPLSFTYAHHLSEEKPQRRLCFSDIIDKNSEFKTCPVKKNMHNSENIINKTVTKKIHDDEWNNFLDNISNFSSSDSLSEDDKNIDNNFSEFPMLVKNSLSNSKRKLSSDFFRSQISTNLDTQTKSERMLNESKNDSSCHNSNTPSFSKNAGRILDVHNLSYSNRPVSLTKLKRKNDSIGRTNSKQIVSSNSLQFWNCQSQPLRLHSSSMGQNYTCDKEDTNLRSTSDTATSRQSPSYEIIFTCAALILSLDPLKTLYDSWSLLNSDISQQKQEFQEGKQKSGNVLAEFQMKFEGGKKKEINGIYNFDTVEDGNNIELGYAGDKQDVNHELGNSNNDNNTYNDTVSLKNQSNNMKIETPIITPERLTSSGSDDNKECMVKDDFISTSIKKICPNVNPLPFDDIIKDGDEKSNSDNIQVEDPKIIDGIGIDMENKQQTIESPSEIVDDFFDDENMLMEIIKNEVEYNEENNSEQNLWSSLTFGSIIKDDEAFYFCN